jgi:hydrogenase/urease accessory protein HupE
MMKIQIWSKTKTGKWASIFTLLFIVLMAIKLSVLAITIQLPFPVPFIAGLGVIGFTLGIISVFKNKDRSFFVLLSIPVGLLIIFWVAAEIVFPH